jgi:excisionase family DNA binding protein
MKYLTVKQVADQLQVSPATVYHLCAEQRLEHRRIGVGRGTIRISEEHLQKYLEVARGTAGEERLPRVPLRDITFRGSAPA